MFWLFAWGNLHDEHTIHLWLVLKTFWIRAVKGGERNQADIWSYSWNLCGKQEMYLQTTKKQDLNIEKNHSSAGQDGRYEEAAPPAEFSTMHC